MAAPLPKALRSPPTDRVLAIIDSLAEEPSRPQSAAELGRRLEISSATCHAILATLVARGYVVRSAESKRYRLGPRLLAVGQSTQEALSPHHVATADLQHLSEETHCGSSLRAVNDGQVVVLARFGEDRHDHSRPGASYPFAPPFGLSFALWSGDRALKEWIARAPTEPSPKDLSALRALTTDARARGYIAHRALNDAREALYTALVATRGNDRAPALEGLVREALQASWVGFHLLHRAKPSDILNVSTLSAPIFDARGDMSFLVELSVGRDLSHSAVEALGTRLASTAREITATGGGRDPWR